MEMEEVGGMDISREKERAERPDRCRHMAGAALGSPPRPVSEVGLGDLSWQGGLETCPLSPPIPGGMWDVDT